MKQDSIQIYGEYSVHYWKRIICLFKGHKIVDVPLFGITIKQCTRCGKEFFKD